MCILHSLAEVLCNLAVLLFPLFLILVLHVFVVFFGSYMSLCNCFVSPVGSLSHFACFIKCLCPFPVICQVSVVKEIKIKVK